MSFPQTRTDTVRETLWDPIRSKLLHLLTLGCRDLGSSSLVVSKAVLIRYAT